MVIGLRLKKYYAEVHCSGCILLFFFSVRFLRYHFGCLVLCAYIYNIIQLQVIKPWPETSNLMSFNILKRTETKDKESLFLCFFADTSLRVSHRGAIRWWFKDVFIFSLETIYVMIFLFPIRKCKKKNINLQ